MDWFRGWLIAITAAAMLNAVAGALMPKGTVRQIGKLLGGLVILLAMIQPLFRLDTHRIAAAFAPYMEATYSVEDYDEKAGFHLMKDIIERECEAYLQNKAAELGIECRIRVVCGEEGEYPLPEQVCVYGRIGQKQRTQLTEIIESDLAVSAQEQIYLQESGEKS